MFAWISVVRSKEVHIYYAQGYGLQDLLHQNHKITMHC
jgi:hypothetical protein